MNATELDILIATRRSVFQQSYTAEKVADSIVNQMIMNATWAPTHKLTQPWRFVVFTGDGIKHLAESQSAIYKEVTERDGTFRQDKYESLQKKPFLSSHIIAVCMVRDPKRGVPEIEEVGAVFCAVQNMYLTAHAYGIGCYLSTGGITYFEEAKPLFGLQPEDKLLGFMHVGTPKEQPRPAKRKSVDEVVEWVRG
ncbi:MAG TPA: nitroreductase [Chryseosolibacter sp.]